MDCKKVIKEVSSILQIQKWDEKLITYNKKYREIKLKSIKNMYICGRNSILNSFMKKHNWFHTTDIYDNDYIVLLRTQNIPNENNM